MNKIIGGIILGVITIVVLWYKSRYDPETVGTDVKRQIADLEAKREKIAEERRKVCGQRGADVKCKRLVDAESKLSAEISTLRARL